MSFKIEITWSKILAFLMLTFAFVISIREHSVAVFLSSLPAVVALITGKQYNDRKKPPGP